MPLALFSEYRWTRDRDHERYRDSILVPVAPEWATGEVLLTACVTMNTAEHKYVGPAMHDRIIGALETCCRQGEMLRIQNRHVDWTQHQIVIPGAHTKDTENRRVPFDPQGRLAPILKRRATLGPQAFVFGSSSGEFQESFKTAWESLLLLANAYESYVIGRVEERSIGGLLRQGPTTQ
jgi:integrase